jgi:hypothetical protein
VYGGEVPVGGRRVNEGDEGEGIWLMDFIYLYEIKQRNLLHFLEVGQGWSQGGETVGTIQPMYNKSQFGIVTMNTPCSKNVS